MPAPDRHPVNADAPFREAGLRRRRRPSSPRSTNGWWRSAPDTMNLMHPHDAEPLDGVVGTDDHPSDTSPRPRSRRWAWGLGVTAAIEAPTLFFTLSPWPGTRIIRWIFNRDSAKVLSLIHISEPTRPY